MAAIYGCMAGLSLLLLVGYCCIAKKKDVWYLLLFASVLVVNIGYCALAVSQNLEEALLANRLAYLGSVFLPLSMWMIILNVTRIPYRKWLPGLLLGLGVVIFCIAASPGYLDIYYKEVTFQKIDGVTVLNKVYGPLHKVYYVYLLGYFAAMVIAIVYATVLDLIKSIAYAAILAVAVFVNIGVWLIGQLVKMDFEILSVSYVITESFLLGLYLLQKEQAKLERASSPHSCPEETAVPQPAEPIEDPAVLAQAELFLEGLPKLTAKERELYNCYTQGMSTPQILEALAIKENTLKYHNKNLYGKLGVSSRKQLQQLHRLTRR